jgi:1-acyl-sn-glycerol-3-phosphate acyltransferase
MTAIAASTKQEPTLAVEAKPHRWALSWPARMFRRLGRHRFVTRHVEQFCQPFEVEGREHLAGFRGPALIIANHTSHFDSMIALSVLPERLYDRTAVVAAADRFFTNWRKGAWHSLRYNAFPISRGGGRAALAYSQWLLKHGWSLLIFPEGRRSRTGELLPFHPGPAIMALTERVPVVPIHIEGAIDILPAGERVSRAARVRVRIGAPLWLGEGTPVAEATAMMEQAVRRLGADQPKPVAEREPVTTSA